MFSATDIAKFLACPHTATLARAESKKRSSSPSSQNAAVDLLRKLGLQHEHDLRELVRSDGLAVAQIDVDGAWETAVARQSGRCARASMPSIKPRFWMASGAGERTSLYGSTSPVRWVVVLRGCGNQARTLHEGDGAGPALFLFGITVADSRYGAHSGCMLC